MKIIILNLMKKILIINYNFDINLINGNLNKYWLKGRCLRLKKWNKWIIKDNIKQE